MKEDKPYVLHILDSISKLQGQCRGLGKENFVSNEVMREYGVRKLEIIGEAVKQLSGKLKEAHTEVEWQKIAGMRDKLIHHYMGVDYGIVWDAIANDIPKLKKCLEGVSLEYKD